MMNYPATYIGFIAAILTTVAFVPQILKAWKSRKADDISLGMYCVFTLGVALWLVYGCADSVLARHHRQRGHAGAGGPSAGDEDKVRLTSSRTP